MSDITAANELARGVPKNGSSLKRVRARTARS